jgi:hypothetical protein
VKLLHGNYQRNVREFVTYSQYERLHKCLWICYMTIMGGMFVNLLYDYYHRNVCEFVTWWWLYIIRGMFVNLLHIANMKGCMNVCEFVTWLLSEEYLWTCYMMTIYYQRNVREIVTTWWDYYDRLHKCLWNCYMRLLWEVKRCVFVKLLNDYYQRNVSEIVTWLLSERNICEFVAYFWLLS